MFVVGGVARRNAPVLQKIREEVSLLTSINIFLKLKTKLYMRRILHEFSKILNM
ncbi:hypothetical protein Hanom_Chr14g01278691 [Helianthus anomalus]